MTSLARALAGHALATFRSLPEQQRASALAGIDAALAGFVAAPAPSTYLAAVRHLAQVRQRTLLACSAAPTMERARQHGLQALREVPGFPGSLVDRLETRPAGPRTGHRLTALASLATAYPELAVRVAADTSEMRRRLRPAVRRGRR